MSRPTAINRADELAARLAREEPGDVLPGRGLWVATAPGSLDVMGGLSEAYGALTLSYPLGDGVTVGVQRREDGQVVFNSLPSEGSPAMRRCRIPLERFRTGAEVFRLGRELRDELLSQNHSWALPLAGVLFATLENRVPGPDTGWTVISWDHFNGGNVDAHWQAAAAAAVTALQSSQNLSPPAEEVSVLCQRAACLLGGMPYGVSGFLCAQTGEAGKLLHLRCRPHEVLGHLVLPTGLTVCGIDCGQDRAVAVNRFLNARTTILMGIAMIRAMDLTSDGAAPRWRGYLTQISIAEFVSRIRDRLPVRLRGQVFLDRYGQTEDPLCRVDPQTWYRVRSRTEHPIYEHVRVQEFAEGVNRSARSGDRTALAAAGEVMYVSHWSYGHRCGLGDVVTDSVVASLRRAGPARGIYGARIGAIGSGGMVAVVLGDTESAWDAVGEAIESVPEPARNVLRIYKGSISGAGVTGAREVVVR